METKLSEDQCSCCFKKFCSKNSRIKHENTSKCFYNKVSSKEFCDHEKIKELENIIKELEKKNTPTIINNTNNTNNTIIQNNFVLSKYGQEDISYITDKQKKDNFNSVLLAVSNMVIMKHYDKTHPENCNVYISNLNGPIAFKYDGTNWVPQNKKILLDEIYGDIISIVFEDFKQIKHSLPTHVVDNFINYKNNEKYDDDIKNNSIENIGYNLYSHRKQAMDVRKITESPTYKLENSIENK